MKLRVGTWKKSISWMWRVYCGFLLSSGSLLFASPVFASDWLTVTEGDVVATTDVVQIDPSPVSIDGPIRIMNVRLNRAAVRHSTDGVTFRSFTSIVEFNCTSGTARFLRADFYAQPLWAGPIHTTLTYRRDQIRPMEFRSVEPNPKDRVFRAVCSLNPPVGR